MATTPDIPAQKAGTPNIRAALLVFLAAFAISSFCSLTIHHFASKGILEEVQSYLLSMSGTASALTNGDLHQTLTRKEQKNTPEYLKVQEPYRLLLKANTRLRYIYTCILKNGKIYFIIDTNQNSYKTKEEERGDTANIMEEYPDATKTLAAALEEKKAIAESETYSDEWGTFLSGYSPIYNGKGEFLGIVGADIDAADYSRRIRKLHYALLASLAAGLLLSASVGAVVLRS